MSQEPTYTIPGDQLPIEQMSRRINIGRLWAGGLATAIVAGLIVVVGVLVSRQVLGIPVLSAKADGGYGNGTTTTYALLAAAAAVLATILMHLLLLAVPSPAQFFGWILGLIVVAAAILPFTETGPTDQKVASAVINLLVGLAIFTLLNTIAASCVRRPRPLGRAAAPTTF